MELCVSAEVASSLFIVFPALFQVDVLEYIHENAYVHADIKAANLMLGYRDPEQVSTLVLCFYVLTI